MATSSPVPSTNSADTATTTTTTTNATATSTPAPSPSPAPAPAPTPAATTPTTTTMTTATTPTKTTLFALANPSPNSNGAPKSLRGLNKPKCSKCGNVARSRCPYQSCKSCCAKAQNPCHIHVLKANASFPDKAPASSSPLFDQKSTDVSPSGASLRVNSLRQLSQFNGTQVPFRARRPLTRKDAAALNQWRFSKLKEYKDSYIEAENEAFDRYMKNVSLLEEAFLVKNSYEAPSSEESAVPNSMSTHMEDNTRRMISGIKLQLRSNPKRAETFRKKIQEIVDQGLNKLCKLEADNDEVTIESNDLDDLKDPKPSKKAKIGCAEWVSALDDLTDKLNKARNEEDLQSCLQMKFQLFNKKGDCTTENKVVETVKEQNVSKPRQGPDHLLPRLCRKVEINQETLQSIEMQFASLDQADEIDDL